MTLLHFLYKNNKWLSMSNKDLYNFAVGVARSRRTSREKTMINIQSMLKKYMIDSSSTR